MITIYMDETKIMNGRKYLGYGALIVSEPDSCNQVISDALSLLSNADNKTGKDDKIIAKGYFHASSDTPNAHSAICSSILKLGNSKFVSHFLDATNYDSKQENEIYDYSAFYSTFSLQRIREPIRIVMEQRNKLSSNAFKQAFTKKYEELLFCCYDQPFISLTFPKIEFVVSDKNNSGLQICDFLLWATGRKINGNSVWYDRIRALFKTEHKPKSGNFIDISMDFTRKQPQELTFYEIQDYDPDFEKNISVEMLWNLFFEAYMLIKQYGFNGVNSLPKHAVHLQNEIDRFCQSENKNKYLQQVEKAAMLYLKLFDTIPLIDKTTPKDKRPFMLYTKRFMGLLLMKHLNQAIRMTDFFACNLKGQQAIPANVNICQNFFNVFIRLAT